ANATRVPPPPRGDPAKLAQFTEPDRARLRRWSRFLQEQSGYMKLQSTRPQTLAYALTDSPAGQLAWIIEKFKEWTGPGKLPEDAVDRDLLLTNATIYWLTGTAGPSAQLYYEAAGFLPTAPAPPTLPPLPVPLGVAVYPHDIILPIRRLADRAFPNIVRWSEFDQGGHFAALEQPALFVHDLRSFAHALPPPQAPPGGGAPAAPAPTGTATEPGQQRPPGRWIAPSPDARPASPTRSPGRPPQKAEPPATHPAPARCRAQSLTSLPGQQAGPARTHAPIPPRRHRIFHPMFHL